MRTTRFCSKGTSSVGAPYSIQPIRKKKEQEGGGTTFMVIVDNSGSRPDATDAAAGAMSHRPCSAPDRLTWTNITNPEAGAACMAIGARLCTEAEWQRACETDAGTPLRSAGRSRWSDRRMARSASR